MITARLDVVEKMEHAGNVIDNMKSIATSALKGL